MAFLFIYFLLNAHLYSAHCKKIKQALQMTTGPEARRRHREKSSRGAVTKKATTSGNAPQKVFYKSRLIKAPLSPPT